MAESVEAGKKKSGSPRLFDLRHYHGSFTEPLKAPEAKTHANERHSAVPQNSTVEEQLPLYLESASDDRHIWRAFRENVKKESDPKLREVVEAGRADRKSLAASRDYSQLAGALDRVRQSSKAEQPITKDDLAGATQYTTLEFIEGFAKKYGYEPPAVGVLVPPEKWEKTVDGKPGLAAKLGMPDWAGGTALRGRGGFASGPYTKSGMIILRSDIDLTLVEGREHELLHSVYGTRAKGPELGFELGSEELYFTIHVERALVNEMNAYRSTIVRFKDALKELDGENFKKLARLQGIPDSKAGAFKMRVRAGLENEERMAVDKIKEALKGDYVQLYENGLMKITGSAVENGKIVTKTYDKDRLGMVSKNARSRIDAAFDAVKYMDDAGVPERKITRRLMAAGPTAKELTRDEFYSPLEDVIAWGKYTEKEVKAGKYSPKTAEEKQERFRNSPLYIDRSDIVLPKGASPEKKIYLPSGVSPHKMIYLSPEAGQKKELSLESSSSPKKRLYVVKG